MIERWPKILELGLQIRMNSSQSETRKILFYLKSEELYSGFWRSESYLKASKRQFCVLTFNEFYLCFLFYIKIGILFFMRYKKNQKNCLCASAAFRNYINIRTIVLQKRISAERMMYQWWLFLFNSLHCNSFFCTQCDWFDESLDE